MAPVFLGETKMKVHDFKLDPLTGEEFYEVHMRGTHLLLDPLLNKGAGFTSEERSERWSPRQAK